MELCAVMESLTVLALGWVSLGERGSVRFGLEEAAVLCPAENRTQHFPALLKRHFQF